MKKTHIAAATNVYYGAAMVIMIALLASLIVISTQKITCQSKLVQAKEKASVSITFRELDEKERSKICLYIKKNYKRIPSSTASLIAKNTVSLAKKYNVPISAILGVMEVESSFSPSQVSSAKARGLMQVRWSVWKDVLKKETNMKSEFDLHEIDNGIEAGIIVLKYYINKDNGDLSTALYNYVGKSKDYVVKVYKATGRFMLYERDKVEEETVNKN